MAWRGTQDRRDGAVDARSCELRLRDKQGHIATGPFGPYGRQDPEAEASQGRVKRSLALCIRRAQP